MLQRSPRQQVGLSLTEITDENSWHDTTSNKQSEQEHISVRWYHDAVDPDDSSLVE